MKHASADEAIAFLQIAVLRYRAVFAVGTDQGRNFQGSFRELLDENLVDDRMSKAYHPLCSDREGYTDYHKGLEG